MTATRNPRIRIVNHGPKNWRTEAQDDCGDWAITGPPYATKLEALSMVAEVERISADAEPALLTE